MDQAALPALVDRQLATGVTPLQATTLAKGALEEAWLTADSDGGVFWCTPDGVIRYVDPNGLRPPSSPSHWRCSPTTRTRPPAPCAPSRSP